MYKILHRITVIITIIFCLIALTTGLLLEFLYKKNESLAIAFATFTVLFILSFALSLIFCCFKNN